ncbi:MAG: RagB/SusD family nutrient uptake outer membrane protein [Muribaculaceae bacterium]|nr:RagB/SusD family nutrient uptake outer membrane protein [Muribaculaceae bacterium]
MKKYFINIFSVLLVGFSMTSCNDWLDGVEQTATVDDMVVWESEASVDKNVNAFYTYLHKYGQFGESQFGGSLTESLTDAFKYGSVALGHRAGHPNNYVMNPTVITPDGCLYSVWTKDLAYGNIRQINQFLAMQRKYSKFTPEQNNLWEAQARFFRAFVYFQLAKRHGGVILYDDLPVSSDKAVSTAEETWDFIEKDLEFAANNLPEKQDSKNVGRITKGAVLAFTSRAMLYAERWQAAYNAVEALQKLSIYGLVDDYAEAWKGNNKECILAFDYSKTVKPNHTFDKYYVPQCDGYDFGSLGTPTQEMVECYETKDGKKVDWSPWHVTTDKVPPYDKLEPRFAATVIYRGSTWKGRVMDCSVGGKNGAFMAYREQSYSYGKTTTGYFLRKLLDESLINVKNGVSSQPWVEIRYAEVLLNKAEAAYHLNKITEAQSAMNEVRDRVGLPGVNVTGEEWFKAYRNERKVELAYEGHLFWDMRRWKLAHIEYNNYRCHGFKITNNTYEYIDCDGEDRKFPAKLYVLPVPTSELKNNSLALQYDEWR